MEILRSFREHFYFDFMMIEIVCVVSFEEIFFKVNLLGGLVVYLCNLEKILSYSLSSI